MTTDHTVRMRTVGAPPIAQPKGVMDAKTVRVGEENDARDF